MILLSKFEDPAALLKALEEKRHTEKIYVM